MAKRDSTSSRSEDNILVLAKKPRPTKHENNAASFLFPVPRFDVKLDDIPDVPEVPDWDIAPIKTPSMLVHQDQKRHRLLTSMRYVGEAIGRLSPLLFTITSRSFQLYLGWVIYLTFIQDVDWEVYRKFMENSLEVAQCATRYRLNYCATKVIPALVDECTAWKLCMDTNPESVPRLEIMSRLFGQMVERFMENFSLRTLIFFLFVLLITYRR